MADKEERVRRLRRELILGCIAQHMEIERDAGTDAAVEHAISALCAAAEFLSTRIGEQRTRATVGRLYASV